MAYLSPHFDFDVFVSYSHGDPRGTRDAPLRGWTRALVSRLESQILSLDTEFDDLKIWIDAEIDPTAHLTDELRSKVGSSGILMIVMSKRYLASSWCRDELGWFGAQIRDRSADQGRVFVLRIQPTDSNAWPEFLRDERGHGLPGFEFFDHDGIPFGWPDLGETNTAFKKELCRLQIALTKRLRELRDRAEKRAAAAASTSARLMPSSAGPRRVYLYAQPDHARARDDIGRQLLQDGIAPLTQPANAPNNLGGWQKDSGARMEAARRCQALALVRADDDQRFVGDLLDIGVDEREQIATARGAPLPCAVLDRTGAPMPIDVTPFGIDRFDLSCDAWRREFRDWLDRPGAGHTGASP
jgi:hypothetical protein